MVGSMMMGFADVPIEIRRARKAKGVQTPSSQNGESSEVINGIEASQRRRPSVQTSSADTHQYIPSSPASNRVLNIAETPSKRSTSSCDAGSGDLYADSTHTPEVEGIQPSPIVPEALNSNKAAPKKDYQILQTSNGVVLGTSKAIGKIIVAGLMVPFEVSLSATRGFHNVPKFYGDDTVRPHERITGVWSGLKAAGKVITATWW
jgi:hypothetical protein